MEMNERLIAAREQAGFKNAADAARSLNVNYQTYAGHENGNSGFRGKSGMLYARKFKVRFEWLMTGKGPMVDLSATHRVVLEAFDTLPPRQQDAYVELLLKIAEPYRSEAHTASTPEESPKENG